MVDIDNCTEFNIERIYPAGLPINTDLGYLCHEGKGRLFNTCMCININLSSGYTLQYPHSQPSSNFIIDLKLSIIHYTVAHKDTVEGCTFF